VENAGRGVVMWSWVVVGILALATVGCQSARLVVPIALDPRGPAVPTDPRLLTTHEAAVRGIAAILVHDLSLPLPAEVEVYVYPSRRRFEDGLVRDARLSPERAARLSASALGVSRPGQLLFHDVPSERGREWLRLVAHELTHVAQCELAGGERGPAQWIKEGMAEWVAFDVLERLRLDSAARRRQIARDGVRRSVLAAGAPLDLDGLGSAAGFTARHRSDGAVGTYHLSFLMVDRLMAGGGLARVAEYFRAFAASDDRHANFERVFGLTLAAFERTALEDLAAGR
jgi:hypothetical protein